MKQLLLFTFILSLSLPASSHESVPQDNSSDDPTLSDYRPTVVEGRTWWYTCAEDGGRSDVYEFGLRIGDIVEIDGEQWYEVTKILSGYYPESGAVSFDPEPMTAGYVREEHRTLFSRLASATGFYPLETYYRSSVVSDSFERPITVCEYGNRNDIFTFGTSAENMDLEITDVDEIENSGNRFRRFTSRCLHADETLPIDDLKFVEGIGFTEAGHRSQLFYFPFGEGFMTTPYLNPPMLRYVTDGDDNVIYENIGGRRLWADHMGVGSVISDGQDVPVEWFNLQGVAVGEPTVPGIYLRRCGTTTHKVVVR